MTNSSHVVCSVSEQFIADNPIIPFVQMRNRFADSLASFTVEVDGQLLPRTGRLVCEPLADVMADGYEWQWVAHPGDGPDLAEWFSRSNYPRPRGAAAGRYGNKEWSHLPAGADPTAHRAIFLLADVVERYYPNTFGFLRDFASAGIPMLHMHGFNVGPTWGRLVVSVDWGAEMGPELVFEWEKIDADHQHPGSGRGHTYAGELAMRACYERSAGSKVKYRFTKGGIVKFRDDDDEL